MVAEPDGVLEAPEGERRLRGAVDAEEVRRAPQRDDEIVVPHLAPIGQDPPPLQVDRPDLGSPSPRSNTEPNQ